jgi:serine/threonine-protein kinase
MPQSMNGGQVINGRYRIARLLGQGGMGAVYKTWDLALDIPVALKEMQPDPTLNLEAIAELREQFRQEALVLANLDHPNLPRVTDFFTWNNNDYLIMDFVEGENLMEQIERQGPLPAQQVIAWAEQLLDALETCHQHDIIHRDIKPQNIIIRRDGRAVLVDFGLVKLWDPDKPKTQRIIRGMGTPEYASPEHLNLQRQHTEPRSDIYSLGATLYHALAGSPPPPCMKRYTQGTKIKPLRQLGSDASVEIENVILQAMSLDINRRFTSAAEMRKAINNKTFQVLSQEEISDTQPERLLLTDSITLDCTAMEAKTTTTYSSWSSEVSWILDKVTLDNELEGRCLTLVGYPGIGITEILNLVKSKIRGNSFVFAQVGGTYRWMNPHEILRALSRQKGDLKKRKLKRAIKECKKEVSLKSQEITTNQKSSLKLSLPLELSFGTFKITPPVEWAREKSVSSTSKPKQVQLPSLTTDQLEALRDLIDYLVEKDVKVILVIDKVLDTHILQPLYPLLTTPGVMLILTTYYQYYKAWKETDFIRRNFLKEVCFLERKWKLSRYILDSLISNSVRDTEVISAFYDYMEFQTRGIPRRFWENFKDFYKERTTSTRLLSLNLGSKTEPILEISSRKTPRIRKIAGIQAAIDWQQIFRDHQDMSWLQCLPRYKQDYAKSVVYKALDWLLTRAERQKDFRLRDFQDMVYEEYSLDLVAGRSLSNLISSNIIDMLGVEYKSRGYDATGILH